MPQYGSRQGLCVDDDNHWRPASRADDPRRITLTESHHALHTRSVSLPGHAEHLSVGVDAGDGTPDDWPHPK